MTEARELLTELRRGHNGLRGSDGPCDCDACQAIDAFIAQDTAKEAVLVAALKSLRARAIRRGDASTLEHRIRMADSDIRLVDAALADTSPAVAALLAQRNELSDFHELTGMDGIEFEKTLDEATGLRDWTGTPNGAMFRALLAQGEGVKAIDLLKWMKARPGASWVATIRDVAEVLAHLEGDLAALAPGEDKENYGR